METKYYKSVFDGHDWGFKTKYYFAIDFSKKENEMICIIYEKLFNKTKIKKGITVRKDFFDDQEITEEEYFLNFNEINNEK